MPSSVSAAERKLAPSWFSKLGLKREADLLFHLPLRYENETELKSIRALTPGEKAQAEGIITVSEIRYRPRRTLIVMLADDSGELVLRFLNFYPNQAKALAVGTRLRVFGEVREGYFGREMVHPKYTLTRPDDALPSSYTPVYPTVAGVSQRRIREAIAKLLTATAIEEVLPETLTARFALPTLQESLRLIHAPPPGSDLTALLDRTHPAWRRLQFEELLAHQLLMRMFRAARANMTAVSLAPAPLLGQRLLKQLPFALTAAQLRAYEEIAADLARSQPMHRLLQGDVGSGKTIVAALACAQAIEAGFQTAVAAPTELLAEQHFRKLFGWFQPLGVDVALLSSGLSKRERERVLRGATDGSLKLIVGTHALFQGAVTFKNLALAIVDEQHRFGVRQRLALREKGEHPHQLMMSATPIPRTLAMAYYADLDVSTIDEMPPGRTPVTTRLVAETRRDEVCERVRAACRAGAQAYWVCPLIEESEALELKTALQTYEALSQAFSDLRVGLVHGRMRSEEKAEIMQRFTAGDIDVLVATTVIEVGVDVPNASLMIIEHAERMGLSQLHQLRGRVGRGAGKSSCILLYQPPLSDLAKARLKVVYESHDGFEIARQDLLLRGPGEISGARQSGVPAFRIADVMHAGDLLERAREAAALLAREQPEIARRQVERWLPEVEAFLSV